MSDTTHSPSAPATRLHHLFDAWLQRAPQRVFVHHADGELSFADLDAVARALQHELRADGVRPGDRVLVLAENTPEHVALIVACSRLGAWSCGVNARMAPGEVDAFVQLADARQLYFTSGVSAAARAHADRLGAQASVCAGLQRGWPNPHAVAESGPQGVDDRFQAPDVAALIFTSGTTGRPKGVLLTHPALLHFARVSAASRALGPDDRSYAFVPMTHIFGLGTILAASLHAGSSLVMRHAFDPDDLLRALAHERVSMLQGPPTLFARLLQHLDAAGNRGALSAPHLRYAYTGAGPLDAALKARTEARLGLPLHHGYASSEVPGCCVTPMDAPRTDTSAGYPLPGLALRLVDGEGRDVAPGDTGEIWIRGPNVTPGYFRDADATRAVFRPGGWYASGDLGRHGSDGALHVAGRLKELIIRSGFNVYPAEVEAALNLHPSVQRAAVVGRPEADGNEQVLAFLELRHGHTLDEGALRAHLAQHLSPYKRPQAFVVVDALPMTESGKLLKRRLLEHQPT